MNKTYAQKAVEAVRDIPHDGKTACLWEFPEEDFAAHQAMPDTPQLESYGDYLAVLAALQADMERRGVQVIRARFSVTTMLSELKRHNWPNDLPHRARVTTEQGVRL